MNLSLYKLRKKLNTDKSGQGSLVAVILASVIGTIIISSTTQWFLSMNKTMDGTNDRLEAMTIAMSEWQRLEHMSLDELEANRENYKNPYDVGEKFKVGVTLGEQGFFDEGKCNSLTGTYAGENANCFKDTIMTVYDKDGNAIYTTRSLPLSVSRDSFPEGTILPYTGDLAKIPHGWVLCDGNNGTPDLRGRFLEGTGSYSGEFKDAGLPNITGTGGEILHNDSTTGALYYYNFIGSRTYPEGPYSSGRYGFDASRSNPIYGRSDTVQPKSYTVFYIMKTNQDFHYNHTNPADTPSFYTKEEVDQLLENERNNVANNYINKNSNDYIKNNTPSKNLSAGYVERKNGKPHIYFYDDITVIPVYYENKTLDYKSAEEIDIQKGFIAPVDGVIFYTLPSGCGAPYSSPNHPSEGILGSYSDITVNGIKLATNGLGCQFEGMNSISAPVKKGDIVSTNHLPQNNISGYGWAGSNAYSQIFVPYLD